MNLDEFINSERRRLTEERLRLSARSSSSIASNTKNRRTKTKEVVPICPAQIVINNPNSNKVKCKVEEKLSSHSLRNPTKNVFPTKSITKKEVLNASDRNVVKNQVPSKQVVSRRLTYSAATTIPPASPSPPKTKLNGQQSSKPSMKLPSPPKKIASPHHINNENGQQDLSYLALDLEDNDSIDSNETFSLYASECPENDLENAAALLREQDDYKISLESNSPKKFIADESKAVLSKKTKELVNQKQQSVPSTGRAQEEDNSPSSGNLSAHRHRKQKKDDMEQWVTDTFYSYFPAYSNELQNRQHFIREKQAEYQQNLLKHQMLEQNSKQNAAVQKKRLHQNNPEEVGQSNLHSTRPTYPAINTNRNLNNASHLTNKTDLEIINVNNPNYEPPKYTPRPGSARDKHMQDLKHTDFGDVNSPEPYVDINRSKEELAIARKKEYQRELMAQIEEKRRSVEILREKERLQEEALTRRLQEQLKTIHLEEQLENEKLMAEKIRIETKQNRIMRANMLAKLENDAKVLFKESKPKFSSVYPEANKENALFKGIPSSTSSAEQQNNKVYQYFSNSARHEYRRGQPLPAGIELDLEIPEMKRTERECFHLCEKICPLCDEPLKTYETCCLRCQRQLSLKISSKAGQQKLSESKEEKKIDPENNENEPKSSEAEENETKAPPEKANEAANDSFTNPADDCRSSFALLPTKRDTSSERSFEVLEVKYAQDRESDDVADSPPMPINSKNQMHRIYKNNLSNDNTHPPYSTNISPNSVFHPDYKLPSVKTKEISFDPLLKFNNVETPLKANPLVIENDIEKIRKETDRRLSRYLKNYSDLLPRASQNSTQSSIRSKSESHTRSTQTTPESTGRRDVVLQDANNLSMPLLREMPKMTRKESNKLVEQASLNNAQRKIDNLKRRWEIPAVQKFSISPNSPRILTQVGAIRKQLQAEYLFEDDDHDHDFDQP